MNKKLFVDMDGTLAHFKYVEVFETLYEKGYYDHLAPHKNLVEAVRKINADPSVDVYILSAVLENSLYAEDEKRAWLGRNLPELKSEQIIFTPCGKPKADFIPNLSKNDILLDDYTLNLKDWVTRGGSGVKFINKINSKHGTWKGYTIYHFASPDAIVKNIMSFINSLPEHTTPSVKVGANNITPKSNKPRVYQCPYYKTNDSTKYQVFIAAYDELDAKVLFQLHMRESDKLVGDQIVEYPMNQLKPNNRCLNFENPSKIQPSR